MSHLGVICRCLLLAGVASLGGTVHAQQVTFTEAVQVMSQIHKPIVLTQGDARLAALAEFQGRVMVSSLNGTDGNSLGWVNLDYLAKPNTNNNATTGGASRLWFGPETGPYSVFFKPGKSRTTDNIQVQEAVSIQPFSVTSQSQIEVNLAQKIAIQNHAGFVFDLQVERQVQLFDTQQIEAQLEVKLAPSLQKIGFGVNTKMTNVGTADWHKETGILSLWELGAFAPSDYTTIVMPLRGQLDKVTSYFTPTLDSHTRIQDGVVYYRGDANYMNKIGIPPENTTDIIGSYDAQRKLLTIIQFQTNSVDELYNNSVWYEGNYQAYKGDVINIFNDGISEGAGPFGPFYEIETSSSARALKINESHQHFQNTYHFQGDEESLNNLSVALLGVSLSQIESVFQLPKP